jgi:glycosyltransferase involved in cell wall biosynthesis
MNIGLVIPYNPLEEVGGLEIGTLLLARDLIDSGHNAKIISKGRSGELRGVPICGYADFSQLCRGIISDSPELDVIHWLEIFPNPGEVELQGMTSGLLKALGKKVILMVATSGNLKMRGTGYLANPLLKNTMDAYVVSNPDQIVEFANYGITLNIYIIGFGVDTKNVFRPISSEEKLATRQLLGLPTDKALCLFMGRFVTRKRPDFLLKAWQTMGDVYERAGLVVVGSGMNQHDSIESNIHALAASTRNVHFRDVSDSPEEYYQACDFLLLPSDREGQPNVMMEMMACGNPVIGSDIPGLKEIISNGVNGLLFPKDDLTSFVRAIRTLIDNHSYRTSLGAEARRLIVSTKDVRMVTNQYLELYQSYL